MGLFRRKEERVPPGAVLASFESSRGGQPHVVKVVSRSDVTPDLLARIEGALATVDWSGIDHAYGPAIEVPCLLLAVAVGGDDARREAWWELWGNVHHQGTVYEATVPVVPFIDEVARWIGHPDRVEALSFLREIALADGSHSAEVKAAVRPCAETLLTGWQGEPELVRRALIWLASAFPEMVRTHSDLLALVPDNLRGPYDEVIASAGNRSELDDEAMDRQDELERWALAGWPAE